MEENLNIFESIYERAIEYGKTSYELIRLKTLDKTSDIVSSFVPHVFVFVLITIFLIFLNFGIALWLGEILGKVYFGFFVVAAFYALAGIVMRFLMHKWLKKLVSNFIIKLILK